MIARIIYALLIVGLVKSSVALPLEDTPTTTPVPSGVANDLKEKLAALAKEVLESVDKESERLDEFIANREETAKERGQNATLECIQERAKSSRKEFLEAKDAINDAVNDFNKVTEDDPKCSNRYCKFKKEMEVSLQYIVLGALIEDVGNKMGRFVSDEAIQIDKCHLAN